MRLLYIELVTNGVVTNIIRVLRKSVTKGTLRESL